jgi:hypothetical protein
MLGNQVTLYILSERSAKTREVTPGIVDDVPQVTTFDAIDFIDGGALAH